MRRVILLLLVCMFLVAVFGLCARAYSSPPAAPKPPSKPAEAKSDTSIVFLPFDKAPELVQTVAPVYPEEAKKSHVQALLTLSIVVDKKGAPRSVTAVGQPKLEGRAIESMSKARLEKLRASFAKSAVEAAKKWRFEPAKMDGKPVAARVRVPVGFKIQTESFEAGVGAGAASSTSPNDPSFKPLPSKRSP